MNALDRDVLSDYGVDDDGTQYSSSLVALGQNFESRTKETEDRAQVGPSFPSL